MKDIKRKLGKSLVLWLSALLLLAVLATPALSTLFAAPGSVNTRAIVRGAVKTKKIANGAVTGVKIANGAVTGVKIANGAVTAAKISGPGYVAKTGDQTMAGKLTASSFGYSAPKTSYLSIGAADFNPGKSTFTYDGLISGELYATLSGGAGSQYFMAPVHLPHGAIVKSIRFRFNDSTVGSEFLGEMYRWHWNATPGQMASVTSAGSLSEQSLGDSIIIAPQIDNVNYDYMVYVVLNGTAGSSMSVRQVMITYETTGP